MKRKVHAVTSLLSLVFLASFWVSTVVAECFLSVSAVVVVKQAIAWALLIFVPLIMLTGASGFALGGKGSHPLLVSKRKRMPVIALNGVLVLVPAAIFLCLRARAGLLDGMFYGVQVLELAAGALNITLIALNIRDGIRLGRERAER